MHNSLLITFVLSLMAGLSAEAGQESSRMSSKMNSSDLNDAARVEFSFDYGGRKSSGIIGTWIRKASETQEDRNEVIKTTEWTDPLTGLQVKIVSHVFSDTPAVDWTVYFTNTGTTNTPVLTNIRPLDMVLAAPVPAMAVNDSSKALLVLKRIKGCGAYRLAYDDFQQLSDVPVRKGDRQEFGSWSSCKEFSPFFELTWAGGGVVTAIGWTGQWTASVEGRSDGAVHLSAGMARLNTYLKPGETIRTPRIMQVYWRGDDPDTGYNLFRQAMVRHVLPRVDGKPAMPPIAAAGMLDWSTAFQNGMDQDNQTLFITKAMSGTQFDTYWLDAWWHKGGYAAGLGRYIFPIETPADPVRFSRGMKAIGDLAHKNGYQFLLWLAPEGITKDSPVARAHPDWLLPNGKQDILNFGIPEAREHMTEFLDACIKQWGINVWRTDHGLSGATAMAGEPDPERVGIQEIRYMEGLYSLWDALRSRNPNLLIDNCSGGGTRIDLETCARSIPLWRTDVQALPARQLSANANAIVNQLINGSLNRYMPSSGGAGRGTDVYGLRSSYNGGFILMDTLAAFEANKANINKATDECRRLQKYYFGDFYRLMFTSADPKEWCVFQYHLPSENAGVILAFRRHEAAAKALEVAPKGIVASMRYTVTFYESFEASKTVLMSGVELANLALEIPAMPGSLVVEYTKALSAAEVAGQTKVAGVSSERVTVKGLTGNVREITIGEPAPSVIAPVGPEAPTIDIDLKRMAQWAMNYLIQSPRKEFNYEPVFQCNPMKCPPVPPGHDVVVPCDTDARLDWEWYYMREISGSKAGKDVEAAFHKRMLGYVQDDGTVLSHAGCYNEADIHKVYTKDEYVYHVWGATKILHSLAEDFRRTGNEPSKAIARKIMLRLKKLAIYPRPDTCYFQTGMGAVKQDGTPLPNGWNRMPAPLIEPLINYYLACGDVEALDFAKAYAEGIMSGAQPRGIKIKADGDIDNGHSHATMHAVWGIAHLGIVTGETKYTEFAKRSWDFMRSRGTGAGWFPALPGGHGTDETCLTSDMISNAAMIARGGHPEYFDYVERYLRNRISPCQFIVTPEFEAEYRAVNRAAGGDQVRQGLETVRKLQGGIRSYCGLNDLENEILKGTYHVMAGCCVPEGMRAIYTTWSHVIDRYPESKLGPAGVYVNMSFNRDSKWGRVVSFMPTQGRLTVKAGVKDVFFLRPPHWAPRDQVKAFVGSKAVAAIWSGDYVRFNDVKVGDELTIAYPLMRFKHEAGGIWKPKFASVNVTYEWLGNMVIAVDPPATKTPIFSRKARMLPPPPLDAVE